MMLTKKVYEDTVAGVYIEKDKQNLIVKIDMKLNTGNIHTADYSFTSLAELIDKILDPKKYEKYSSDGRD